MRIKRISPIFVWYDFWRGIYWDREKKIAYILFFPMLGVKVEFEQ